MSRGRITVFALAGALVLAQARGAEAQRLAGTVRDPLGHALAGVEVLILSLDAVAPVAVATSDEDGGFDVAGLLPGDYRCAALKEGYRTFIGRIDTATRRSLDVVLRPLAPGGDATPVSNESSTWALRVPRRGILHERSPGILRESPDTPSIDALHVRVDQLFSGSAQGQGAADSEVHASETSMAVDSALGDHGDLRVATRIRRASSEGKGQRPAHVSRADEGMTIGMSYAPDPEARIELNAHYDRQELELEASRVAPWLRELRAWGYGASYSKRLDDAHQLAVGLDYRDAALAAEETQTSLVNRMARASGRVTRQQGEDHRLTAAFDATSWDAAWNLALDLGDEWSLSGAMTVRTGLRYRQGFGPSPASVVVPSAGARWKSELFDLDTEVSWHALEAGDLGSRGELGFGSSVAIRLAEGLKLEGAAEHEPFLYGRGGDLAARWSSDGPPLWVSDGEASMSHARLGLVEARGYTRSTLELSAGRVTGQLSPLLAFGSSPALAGDHDLSYRDLRVGIAVPAIGTEVSLAYRSIVAAAARATTAEEQESDRQESIDLRVIQELARVRLPGQWRLLVALHMVSTDSASLEAWADEGGDEETVAALDRRVGAGLSVLF